MTNQLERAKAELLKWQVIVEYLEGIDKQKPTVHKRRQILKSVRKRKPMDKARREAISKRMKAFWAGRRKSER